MPRSSSPVPRQAAAPNHYENFPVASWLCPPRLRPPIAALYAFARTADDIADEGDTAAPERLALLQAYGEDLAAVVRGQAPSARWPQVFGPLRHAIAEFSLPESLLADLLDAFRQDVRWTQAARRYADMAELLDYCRRSANPVGRLLLHLAGLGDARSLAQSDAICSALQLINFWQDLSVDLPRGRHYLPLADCAAFGLGPGDFQSFAPLGPARPPAPALALVAQQVQAARALMREGAPLVHRMPGRMGHELRLVVQGGLLILDRIEARGFDSFSHRPTVRKWDAPRLLWRAFRM
ncbi:squalene synthase HpnC [Xenophilus arseniciresistens]|uniref:Squalene synthase HpnC n=1 Tax=Xenophilus arseniciresistens TaxID=1283306 RepID=A0AAE3NAZ6_9BURK|nr:squalene synthase HpnC [Xenophilus arseniciresistens]MDA7417566.1 squalene synthase HpnC [Xenophilus arseniciresistens]